MTGGFGWQGGGLAATATVLAVAAALASVWHYQRAGRSATRRRARALLLARLLAVTLAAAVACKPSLHFADERPRPLRVLIDDSASMATVDPGTDRSRYASAIAAAQTLAASPVAAGGVVVSALDGRTIDLRHPGTPAAGASALGRVAGATAARAAALGDNAMVFISDGRSTGGRGSAGPATGSVAAMFTVAVAAEDRRPAVRAVAVECRPTVLAGQANLVRVRLAARNADGHNARITLTDGGRTQSRELVLAGPTPVADFVWPGAAAPAVRLVAHASLDRGSADAGVAVNVRVLPHRVRIVLLAGPNSGRDVGEAAGLLDGASWIDLVRVPLTRDRLAAMPADVFAADIFVLADVPAGALDATAWAALDHAVRADGRSLWALAGGGDWLADAAVAPYLAGLLPTSGGPKPRWVVPPPEQGVWPVPTRAGLEGSFLRAEETVDATFRAWLQRPKMARLLAVGPPVAGARTMLADRTTRQPVLVEAAAGRGRSALVLIDETWRWPAVADGDSPQRRFWLGLVRDTADLPYDVTVGGIALAVDRPAATAGERVPVRTRVDPAAGPATLAVTRDGVVADTLTPHEPLPGNGLSATTLTLPPGRYDVVLRQGDRALDCPLVVSADDRPEDFDPSPDPQFLKRLAESTGGSAVSLEDLSRLPDLLGEYRTRHPRVRDVPLWESPWWFAAVAAALGLEWTLRSEWGLA